MNYLQILLLFILFACSSAKQIAKIPKIDKPQTKVILFELEKTLSKKYQIPKPKIVALYNLGMTQNNWLINKDYTNIINNKNASQNFIANLKFDKQKLEEHSLEKLKQWQIILNQLKKNNIDLQYKIPKLTPNLANTKTHYFDILSVFHEKYAKFIPVISPNLYPRITSTYGLRCHPLSRKRRFHSGIDLVSIKRQIFAAAEGIVTNIVKTCHGYGNNITIDHGNGLKTFYAHLAHILVTKNQKVLQGELIGIEGKSGKSTGIHLHFEIIHKSKKINPIYFLLLK